MRRQFTLQQEADVRGDVFQSSHPSELENIRRTEPGLKAEDAFLVPNWFPDQYSWVREPWKSNSAVYNLPICLQIRGTLNRQAIAQATKRVQQHHSVLRSIFRAQKHRLTQVVLPGAPVEVAVTEVHQQPVESNTQLWELMRNDALRPFDLTREPALRASLFTVGPGEHILLITVHHLICDDWSTGIFTKTLVEFYRTLTEGCEMPTEMGDFQYGDFIRWQEIRLKGRALESQLTFWKQYLKGRSDYYHLPLDRTRPKQRSYRGGTVQETLPEALTIALKKLSQQSRVSLFMTMLAAFQCVLYRRSGEQDIAVGSCAANRALTSVEPLIGRFANDLVVRTDFSDVQSFGDLLARVRDQALLAYTHQDLPFAGLVEEMAPHADPSWRTPLFQVMFILQDAPKDTLQCPGLTLTRLPFEMGTAKYDLCVFLSGHNGREILLEYDADLFEKATIGRLLQEYRDVLNQVVEKPSAPISNLRGPDSAATPVPVVSCGVVSPASAALIDDPVVRELQNIWERGFGRKSIGLDEDFFELGGDSLLAARLFVQISRNLQVTIPIITLAQAPTIRQLARAIRDFGARDGLQSVVSLQTGGSRPPLFCAHGQSGNLLIYRTLAQHLGTDQPVYGLQPRGLDGKQKPLTSIEEMAGSYIGEVQVIQPHGPYFLAGYCMGGSIVFEMAQQLLARCERIGLLAVLDSYDVGRMRQSFAAAIGYGLQKCWFGIRHFIATDHKNKTLFIKRRLGEVWLPESELSLINARAALAYRARRYPGRVLHVRPLHQFARYTRPELAWDEMADDVEPFNLPIYPGQMFEEPFVRELAGKLRSCIDQCHSMTEAPAT
jgi:pimeloyl-ACP methyl ester carboxylesterase